MAWALRWLALALVASSLGPSAVGLEGGSCSHDTHIECGELVVWNDTQTPASVVLQLRFPPDFSHDSWSVQLSTCHEGTSASTTVRLFDACPLSGPAGDESLGSPVRSPVASNSRDRKCATADRACECGVWSAEFRRLLPIFF